MILYVLSALVIAYAARLVWANHLQNERERLARDFMRSMNASARDLRRLQQAFAGMGLAAREANKALRSVAKAYHSGR